MALFVSLLLALLAVGQASAAEQAKPVCLSSQPRDVHAASNATIVSSLHLLLGDKVHGPCSTSGGPSWSNASLTMHVQKTNMTATRSACVNAFNAIIHDCIGHSHFWGGNLTTQGVKYAIYNADYPKTWVPREKKGVAGTGSVRASSEEKTSTTGEPYNYGEHTSSSAASRISSVQTSSTHSIPAHNTTSRSPHVSTSAQVTSLSPSATMATSYINDTYLSAGPPGPDAAQVRESAQLAQISRDAQARQSYYGSLYSKTHVPSATPTPNSAAAPAVVNCNDGTWALSTANYNKFKTDDNFKTFWFGGRDTDGITYDAKANKNVFLTKSLATTFLPVGSNFDCTLESQQQCQAPPDCKNYGVHLASTKEADPSHWAWFTVHSIANVNSFSQSFAQSLTDAGVELSLDTLDLTQTFTKPSKNQDILTRDLLVGFSALAIAAFIFVPVGAAFAAGGAAALSAQAISSAGVTSGVLISDSASFLGNALIDGAGLDTKAATFGSYMNTVFESSAKGLDSFVSDAMMGQNIGGPAGGTPTIHRLISQGGWVNSEVLTNPGVSLTNIRTLLKQDLTQRGINFIWSQSKIWVSFADLGDDPATQAKCKADTRGWQASKTCADGGVYYLYRYNEEAHLRGKLSYPWGADKMSTYGLDPAWVTKSSAKSYRAQNGGTGGFAYNPSTPPAELTSLFSRASTSGSLADLNGLQGTWNISVCDMGTHDDWNQDFTSSTDPANDNNDSARMPCCCGPGCTQTRDFVQSANMNNFDTLPLLCRDQLKSCTAWPAGVTEIDYGDAGTIQKDDCK